MAGLQFRFAELVRETGTLKVIAKDFLDQSTSWALEELKGNIESLWGATGDRESLLQLHLLKTKTSEGAHERGNRLGGATINAVITGTGVG